MIRNVRGNKSFWEGLVLVSLKMNQAKLRGLSSLSVESIEVQPGAFDIPLDSLKLILRRYSKGDDISTLAPHFYELIKSWEILEGMLQEAKGKGSLPPTAGLFDLTDIDHYIYCFWVVSLALAFGVDDITWSRLIMLIGPGGKDILLDRVIATKSPGRAIGIRLLHPRPYATLLSVLDASMAQKKGLLFKFVINWYAELGVMEAKPFWHGYGGYGFKPLRDVDYFG